MFKNKFFLGRTKFWARTVPKCPSVTTGLIGGRSKKLSNVRLNMVSSCLWGPFSHENILSTGLEMMLSVLTMFSSFSNTGFSVFLGRNVSLIYWRIYRKMTSQNYRFQLSQPLGG